MKYLLILLLLSCNTKKVGTKKTQVVKSKNATLKYNKVFSSLILNIKTAPYKELHAIFIAQWMLESGRGTSRLALDHLNFGGLKWRKEMVGYATPVSYKAHDGTTRYCKFSSTAAYIRGYIHFINRSVYNGWKAYEKKPIGYIKFIQKAGYMPDTTYVDQVIALLPEAKKALR